MGSIRRKISLFTVAAIAAATVTPILEAKAEGNSASLAINVTQKMQTWDGWGTALAWWANMYGGLTNIVDGQEQRKNITDMLFTDKGLNLNIARYNLGTCENPENTNWDTVLNMPPLKKGPDEAYDLSNDPRQIWVLEEFLRVQENPITEMWVNTPPYWMLISGSATGPVSKQDDNLAPENYDDYAAYLVDLLELFESEKGITFDYIEPMNEPNSGYTNYWGPHSGNRINFGTSESGVLNALYDEMVGRGIEGKYPIAATDELSTSQTAIAWGMLDEDAKRNVAKINTHTYSSDEASMRALKKAAYGEDFDYENPKKKLWMSERTLHMGPEPESFYYGIALAEEIIDNINIMGVNAWCHWQAADELGVNETNTDWRYDMQFFTFGNFTRYIVPGSRIIDAGSEDYVAALTPDDKLIVVATTGLDENNPASALDHREKELEIKIKNAKVKSVDMVQTTALSDSWEQKNIAGEKQSVCVTLPEVSVTTFIFELSNVGSGCAGSVSGLGTAGLFGMLLATAAVWNKKKNFGEENE